MNEHQAKILDFVAFKRKKKAEEDHGVCDFCGNYRVVCSPQGALCKFVWNGEF